MGTSDGLAVVLGAGPVGQALSRRLLDDGQQVRTVTRTGAANLPAQIGQVPADISNVNAAIRACAGASVVYGCVGMDYQRWPERWPPMMTGMLAGAESAGARFVFMDNCYMYGPVDAPMVEDMPLTNYGRKPATRATLTRMWQDAHRSGRVEAAAVRASDFYGPGVTQAAIGERSAGRIAAGKSAQVFGNPDLPHSFTYVPDIARALTTVGRADDAMGEAWHVPNAPICSTRDVLSLFAHEFGTPLKVQAMPKIALSALGLFSGNIREVAEMMYQWTRPFVVDSTKFSAKFWSDATPFEQGVAESAPSYRL